MRVLPILFLVFLLVPLAEIYLLIEVGGVIGAVPTIGLVVLTALAGAVLMRAQGFRTVARVHEMVERGEVPALELLEGAVILVAGALLLTPGFVTDAIGFACLIPALRRGVLRALLARRLADIDARVGKGGGPARHIIEGEYRREDD